MQARCAADLESRPSARVTDDDKVAHRGYVVGATMQATAALESEIWEVMVYGLGHCFASNESDAEARNRVAPIADVIGRENALEPSTIKPRTRRSGRWFRGCKVFLRRAGRERFYPGTT